jgi:hypothetical protein
MLRRGGVAVLRPLAVLPFSLVLATAHAPAPRVVASGAALYLEDARTPRPVAAVRAQLVVDGDTLRLELTVAPCGPGVAPVPGFAGRPDANLRTAEELERLLGDGALRLITRVDGASVPGSLLRVERGVLPARRVDANGVVHDELTAAAWPLRVSFASSVLPAGVSSSFLECDGVPRLVVHVDARGAVPTLAIASLAEPPPVVAPARAAAPVEVRR